MVRLGQQGGFPLPTLLVVSSSDGVVKRDFGMVVLFWLWRHKLGSNGKHEKLSSYRRCRQLGSYDGEFSNVVAGEPGNTHRSFFSTSKVSGEATSSKFSACLGEVNMMSSEG
jgi:hypothetical protein